MKRLLHSFAFISILLSLVACNRDNEPALPILSYFKGMENGKYIHIEQNTDYDKRIRPHVSVKDQDDTILSYNFSFLLDKGNGFGRLDVMLAPLCVGSYKISAVDLLFSSDYQSQIAVFTGGKAYQPYKAPFTITIDEIDPTIETMFPHITGRMEGVLYNGKDLKDSITFSNVEFRVW